MNMVRESVEFCLEWSQESQQHSSIFNNFVISRFLESLSAYDWIIDQYLQYSVKLILKTLVWNPLLTISEIRPLHSKPISCHPVAETDTIYMVIWWVINDNTWTAVSCTSWYEISDRQWPCGSSKREAGTRSNINPDHMLGAASVWWLVLLRYRSIINNQ